MGRELLVPDDPSWDDFDLLKKAVEVSSDSDFGRKRAAYWRWQREFFRDGVIVDKETVERAVEEMRELIEEEKAILRKNRCKFALGFCFTLAPAALTFFSGDPNIAIGVGSAFLGLGAFLSDKIGILRLSPDRPPCATPSSKNLVGISGSRGDLLSQGAASFGGRSY
jgi:hypothetical protein